MVGKRAPAPRLLCWPRNLRSPSPPPPLAITPRAPAAVGNARGDALIDAAGIDRNRAAEARSDQADAGGIDRGMLGEKGERVARVLDLLEADHAAELAFALAAAAHVETQHDVA